MKKYVECFLSCGLVAGCLFSCNKYTEEPVTQQDGADIISAITYTLHDFIDDENSLTKVVLDNNNLVWSDGDTVGIYPDQGSQVFFTIESGGATSASFDGGGWAFRYGSTYSAYYPFMGDIYLDKTSIPVDFSKQKQSSLNGTEGIGKYLYMCSNPISVQEGVLNFDFAHLCCLIRFTLTLPAGTYKSVSVTAPSSVFVKKGHYNLSEGNRSIVGDEFTDKMDVALENITLTELTTFKVYAVSAPVDLKGKEVTVRVRDDAGKELELTKTPSSVYEAGHSYGLACKDWLGPVSGVELDRTEASLNVGENLTLTATVLPDNAKEKSVTWSSSDESVATVDAGVVTAKKAGSAIITVKTVDGDYTASCVVTVLSPATGITISKTSITLAPGSSATLTTTVQPDDCTDTVGWTSSDISVVTVNKGTVTAIKVGKAVITAKAGDKTTTCNVTVTTNTIGDWEPGDDSSGKI